MATTQSKTASAPKTAAKKATKKAKAPAKKKPAQAGGILPSNTSPVFENKVQGMPEATPTPAPTPAKTKGRQLDRRGIGRIVRSTLGDQLLKTGSQEQALEATLVKAQELVNDLLHLQAEEENGQFASTSGFLLEWSAKFNVPAQLVRIELGPKDPRDQIRYEPFGRSIERFIESWDPSKDSKLGMELMAAVGAVRSRDREGNERPALWGKVITDLNQKVMERMLQQS